MIITRQRHAGREIEGLTEALQRADCNEVPQFIAPARGNRDETPEQTTAKNEVLARKTIANQTGQRRGCRVDPHESRTDQAKLHLVEAKLLLELWEYSEDGLPVRVIEKADEPQHRDHPPFVIAACSR